MRVLIVYFSALIVQRIVPGSSGVNLFWNLGS